MPCEQRGVEIPPPVVKVLDGGFVVARPVFHLFEGLESLEQVLGDEGAGHQRRFDLDLRKGTLLLRHFTDALALE